VLSSAMRGGTQRARYKRLHRSMPVNTFRRRSSA
jgi:hypothetical protein